ncbi:5173_t:CDS:2 [Rhizophagus irregularis]|nr:5173_t:CDS:2 [Rhizophagus irregularis]
MGFGNNVTSELVKDDDNLTSESVEYVNFSTDVRVDWNTV